MIFHWNTDLEKVTTTLDCSLWVPSIDRYKIDRAHQFEGSKHDNMNCSLPPYIVVYISISVLLCNG